MRPEHNHDPDERVRDCKISSTGALVSYSGERTGRSPKDKRIVKDEMTENDIWWGSVNVPFKAEAYNINRQRVVDYLNSVPRIFVVDGYGGWDEDYRLTVRVICSRPYHALFMKNMLIRPTPEEIERDFSKPADLLIMNAGQFPADPNNEGVTGKTSVAMNLKRKEISILGTHYAGEMKKGLFSYMNYLMPKQGTLSMHASANLGKDGDTTILFGLSGTGKTTLSADEHRALIGDDEHVWTDKGIFNIEGGCYAKTVNLTEEAEPDIYRAIKFGSVLENVGFCSEDPSQVDYTNISLTENTRVCYPLEYIPNCQIPAVGGHPKNIIYLTCDTFGVFPPVSKLNTAQ